MPFTLTRPWDEGNARRITQAIERGAHQGALAAFDWDETCASNDGGDLFWLYMARNDLYRQPPERDWGAVSAHLTDEARRALRQIAGPLAAPGERLPTAHHDGLAAALRGVYLDGRTPDGAPAWRQPASDLWEPGYALAVQLQWGWSAAEMRQIGREAAAWAFSQPVGAQIHYGGGHFQAWVRLSPQMEELLGVLKAAGFTRRIVSASCQPYVEAVAAAAGLSPEEIIGARAALDAEGRQTPGFAACGPFEAGHQQLMTYREGKRAWLNADQGREGEAVFEPAALSIAGGDSPSDLALLRDAEDLRIVVGERPEMLEIAAEGDPWITQTLFEGGEHA